MTHLLCLGDSITDCGRLFSAAPLGYGYVQILAEKLKKDGRNWQLTNCGVDGFTIHRLLENAPSQYLPLHADIITILIGINDIGLMMNTCRTSAQQAQMMEDFFAKYNRLLEILSSANCRIILMEPFLFPWPAEFCTWMPHVRTMSRGIADLAEKYQLPYLPLHDSLNEEARKYGLDYLTEDGIHLTRQGHEFLAKKLYEILPAI